MLSDENEIDKSSEIKTEETDKNTEIDIRNEDKNSAKPDSTSSIIPAKKPRGFFRSFLFYIFNLSLITIFFFIFISSASYFTLWYFIRGEEIEIPNLIGVDINNVLTNVQSLELSVKLDKYEFSEVVPKGHVVSQYPYPGTKAKKGSPIKIIISKGSSLLKVPYVIGENYLSAEVKIRAAGLKVGNHSYINGEKATRDKVIAQDPLPLVGVPKDDPVNLLINIGPAVKKLMMPDLTPYTLTEAKGVLSKNGLNVIKIERRRTSDKPPGMVLEHIPKAGTPITSETSILLIISVLEE